VANQLHDPPLDSAVIDDAHLGDIRGALGTLRWRQLWPARTLRRRLLVMATVMGPGLLALIADNDAGGVATYAQAGAEQGLGVLWVLIPLGVVLFLNQEMAARLGAVSGVGHARLIFERFGKLWGAFSLGDLLVLNALTLLTESIGVRIAAEHIGIPPGAAVLGTAAVLILATLGGGFQRWERVMYLLVALDVALIPVLAMAHAGPGGVAAGGVAASGVGAAGTQSAVLLIVALLGTTVAPWQLFFQQSAVVDKRITPRWMAYARVDTAVGTALMVAGAAAVILVSAAAFSGAVGGHATDMVGVLGQVRSHLGSSVSTVLAVLLLDGAVLGAAALAMSTSYAIGDVTGARHSLHRTPRQAPLFYTVATALVAVSAAIALLPGAPLGFTTVAVQVLAGLLLPSATTFMLVLCNDTAVLGPWANGRLLNALTATSIATLLALSAMLVVTALYPAVPAVTVGAAFGGLAVLGLVGLGIAGVVRRRRGRRALWPGPAGTRLGVVRGSAVMLLGRRGRGGSPLDDERALWRTPPLVELRRPVWTTGRVVAMVALRAYLIVSVLLLAGRVVFSALGH
jgi:Mn2+/Fe2+ NRAMP family transporter